MRFGLLWPPRVTLVTACGQSNRNLRYHLYSIKFKSEILNTVYRNKYIIWSFWAHNFQKYELIILKKVSIYKKWDFTHLQKKIDID